MSLFLFFSHIAFDISTQINKNPMKYFVLILLSLQVSTTYAQKLGTCNPAKAYADLDINQVWARVSNNGGFFWDAEQNLSRYEVPKGAAVQSSLAASFWIGGFREDSLRITASRYTNREFWPGPLDANGNPPLDCTPYDRIWKISRGDLARYEATKTISKDLAEWPYQLGAPVLDGDGNPNNYNLAGGDRPELVGDQMLWWVMNDLGNRHLSTSLCIQSEYVPNERGVTVKNCLKKGATQAGFEVQATAFAFRTGLTTHHVFYRFKVRYTGKTPLKKAFAGIFHDADLGDGSDDYISSDSTLHLAYFYNGTNQDRAFGAAPPPAVGFMVLSAGTLPTDGLDNDRDGQIDEANEMLGLTHVGQILKSGTNFGDPVDGMDYYYALQARNYAGIPLTEGGNGSLGLGKPARFAFSGDPVHCLGWSEVCPQTSSAPNSPADRRMTLGSGSFEMQPNEVRTFVYGLLWARGRDFLDSVTQLKAQAATIKDLYPSFLKPSTLTSLAETPAPTPALRANLYPNPSSNQLTLSFRLLEMQRTTITIFDLLGRPLTTLQDQTLAQGTHTQALPIHNLPNGHYLLRLTAWKTAQHETLPFTVVH